MPTHIWHPYTRHSAAASASLPEILRAEGIYLEAADGRRYIDAVASWWCCALGHGHPAITGAIHAQTDRLQHSILGNLTHPPARALATALAQLMPDARRHVHFASDGASAVEAAMKVALQYHWNRGDRRRTAILSLRQAYHGDTLGTVALGFLEAFHQPFATRLSPAPQLPLPPYDGDTATCLTEARRLLTQQRPTLAAVIVEPLCQGAAGMRLYPPAYLRAIADLTREEGALFIADEIATGFLRTGSMFACEQAGVDPDITCVGKALSAGTLPISATIVKDSVYDAFADTPDHDGTFHHGHTFAGNPIACAAALAALAIYREPAFQETLHARAATLAAAMEPLRSLPGLRRIRSLGLIAALDLDNGNADASRAWAGRVRTAMQQQGYLLRPLGPTLYLMPPLITPEEVLIAMTADLATSITATRSAP